MERHVPLYCIGFTIMNFALICVSFTTMKFALICDFSSSVKNGKNGYIMFHIGNGDRLQEGGGFRALAARAR